MSHNEQDILGDAKQWGGTGILTQGKMAFYSYEIGSDTTGLGRWTWTRFQGKHGIMLRLVSVYQPNASDKGMLSVHGQHKHFLKGNNDDREPVLPSERTSQPPYSNG